MALPPGSRDLPRIAFGVLLIAALLGGSVFVLLPFLPALLWATMIVVATWPLMLKVEAMVGGRRGLATLLCTLLLLLIVFAPLMRGGRHGRRSRRCVQADLLRRFQRFRRRPRGSVGFPFVGERVVGVLERSGAAAAPRA